MQPEIEPVVLTPRELEVLRLLPECATYQQVADRLHISVRTVHRHMQAIFDMTGQHHRHTVIEWARREGLLENNG